MTNKLRLMPANRGAQCIPGTDSVRQGAVQIGFKCNQRNFWRPEFQAWSYVTVGGRLSGTVPESEGRREREGLTLVSSQFKAELQSEYTQ